MVIRILGVLACLAWVTGVSAQTTTTRTDRLILLNPLTGSEANCLYIDASGNVKKAACGAGAGDITGVTLNLPTAEFDIAPSNACLSGDCTFTVTWDNQPANSVFQRSTTAGTPSFSQSLKLATSLEVRPVTDTHGYVMLGSGDGTISGYLSVYKPASPNPLRLGYFGYSASNIGLVLENSANFAVSGGDVSFAGNASATAGVLSLTHATANRIDWAAYGGNAPTFTARSVGTKLVLYPALSGSSVDYGLGIDGATLWFSVPQADASYNWKWYGGQTLVANLTGVGSLTLVGDIAVNGGDITSTASPLNINSAGIINLVDTGTFAASAQSSAPNTFAARQTGWGVTNDGRADFRYIWTDELHAVAFVADLEFALAGGQIISKSVAKVTADLTCPAAGNSTDLYIEEFAGFTGQVFVNGDYVIMRQFARSIVDGKTTLDIATCAGTVTYVSRDDTGQVPTQRYTFTRLASNGGAASGTIKANTLALDMGIPGNGFWETVAIDGMIDGGNQRFNGPYAQAVTWTGSPVSGRTVRTRVGNLSGAYGYGITSCSSGPCWGLAAGDASAANITVDQTNGVRLRYGATDFLRLNANGLSVMGGGNITPNPGFEEPTELGGSPTTFGTGGNGWTLYSLSGHTAYGYSSSGFIGGTGAFYITWSGNNADVKGVYRKDCAKGGWKNDTSYVLSWWAIVTAGPTETYTMRPYWNNSPTSSGGSTDELLAPKLNGYWQRYAYRLNWGSGTVQTDGLCYISITYLDPMPGQTIYIDGVQVEEGYSLSGWSQGMPGDLIVDSTGLRKTTGDGRIQFGTVATIPAYGAPGCDQGLWLGVTSGDERFCLGDKDGEYLLWDGANLTVRGIIAVTGISGLNYAGAQTPGGAADAIVNQGDLATKDTAALGTDTTGNYAGSGSVGGSANDTDKVNGVAAATVQGGAARANSGLDANGWVTRTVRGPLNGDSWDYNWPSGLYLTSSYLGYFNTTNDTWPVYIANNGLFYFGGNGTNFIEWTGSALNIRGVLTAGDITSGGTITGVELRTSATDAYGVRKAKINEYGVALGTASGYTDIGATLQMYSSTSLVSQFGHWNSIAHWWGSGVGTILIGAQDVSTYGSYEDPDILLQSNNGVSYYAHFGVHGYNNELTLGTANGGSIRPETNDYTYLGTGSYKFKGGYFSGNVEAAGLYVTNWTAYGQSSFVCTNAATNGDDAYIYYRTVACGDSSSIRYKTNVAVADYHWDAVLDLVPVTFEYKTRLGERQFGLIAETVEAAGLIPVVNYNEQGEVDSLDYNKLTLYLIPVVRQQRDEIAQLKARIAALETRQE